MQGFQTFLTRDPMSRYWRLSDHQALIFTMIMMIILTFGLLLVIFYDDFPFPYWKEICFYSYICHATPFLRPCDPLALRPPGWETCTNACFQWERWKNDHRLTQSMSILKVNTNTKHPSSMPLTIKHPSSMPLNIKPS